MLYICVLPLILENIYGYTDEKGNKENDGLQSSKKEN